MAKKKLKKQITLEDLARMTQGGFEDLEKKFKGIEKKMDDKFESVDKKFISIEGKIESMDNRLYYQNERLKSIEAKVDMAVSVMDYMVLQQRVTNIEKKLGIKTR